MRNPHTGAETSALLPGGRLQYKSCPCLLSKEMRASIYLKTSIPTKLFFIIALWHSVLRKSSELFLTERQRRQTTRPGWGCSADAVHKRCAPFCGIPGMRRRVGGSKKAEVDFDASVDSFCTPERWYCWAEPHSRRRRVNMDATMSMLTGQRANKSLRHLNIVV